MWKKKVNFAPQKSSLKHSMKKYDGNSVLRYGVLLGDLIILNGLLTVFYYWGADLIPPVFHNHVFLYYFTASACMVMAEFFVPEIVSRRLVKVSQVIERVFEYVLLFSIAFFLMVRLATQGGGQFDFMVIFSPILFVLIILTRQIELFALRHYRQSGHNRRSVVLVGNDHSLLTLYANFGGNMTRDFNVIGYYADKPFTKAPPELKLRGSISELNRVMEANEGQRPCDDVFVSLPINDSDEVVKIAEFCDKHTVHFYYVPQEFPYSRLRLTSERFGDTDVLTNHHEPLLDPRNYWLKRGFDIVFSLVVCMFLIVLIPVIGLIIKLQSPGPIFFKQKRTGINGKTFNCLKFRSMHVNKEADSLQATKDDPRKFAFGNFMRRTNIDELPQFFNVLKGDMSVVGPRPHMLAHTEEYSKLIGTYMVRHFCRPGITGLAQVNGCRGETKELWQMEERVRYDIMYIENWTFWLDMKIIAQTAWTMVHPDKNAY